MIAPRNYSEVLSELGDPGPYVLADGTVLPTWELKILTAITLPAPLELAFIPPGHTVRPLVYAIRCNRACAAELLGVYQAIHDQGLWPRLGRFGGCYAWRTQRNAPHVLSMHCWAAAVDHGSDVDPQGDTVIDTDSRIVNVFETRGWTWGGRWKAPRIDAMHFSWGNLRLAATKPLYNRALKEAKG